MLELAKGCVSHPHNLAVAVALSLTSGAVNAQEPVRQGASSALLEEVVITARKREEGAQDVPVSVSAFNAGQLDALKVRDLTNLSVGMPNVSLEDIGTTRGIANFSIRGLGINSSIPSIDPTVGVFVNGVYLGVNNGIIFDVFDLESIEVLRGPQGTLFGRNVTGGAVLLNTQKPGNEMEATFRYAADVGEEGGLNSYYMGAVGGPLTDTLGGRLVLYYNDDEGRFENDFDGADFGEIEQLMARGTLVWSPTDFTEISVVYEYNETDGEGPAAQSHTNGFGLPGTPVNNDRRSFNFSIDEAGFQESETNFLVAEVNHDVAFGEGTVTAILGYRDFWNETMSDIDSQPEAILHVPTWLEAEQTSFELRYNGVFADAANVTLGAYLLDNDITYFQRNELLGLLTGDGTPFATQSGGGEYEVESYTIFAQVDYDLSDRWTLTAGLNYSAEEKTVEIASLGANLNTDCNIVEGPACPVDFDDDESWSNIAPKLGATYHLDDDRRIYAHWTRGYRSGGYNLRNTDPNEAPGPFDEEEVNNFEVGFKSSNDWGRLNAAIFYNQIDDMQREVNLTSETSGIVQLVRNTADATIFGVEVDATISLTDSLLLLASVGYLDAEYDEVRFDLNGDGTIDGADENLDLPRAPELTWSLGLTHDLDIGDWGYLSSRVNWAYRDDFAYTDNNRGFVQSVDMVDAGFDFNSNDGRWVFSIYGRNLLNEVSFGGDSQLPADLSGFPLGGTFSPLSPGRRYGLEVTLNL
ncbi:MAG: TonB-dependent receptor [Pseudomonadota bacterium]